MSALFNEYIRHHGMEPLEKLEPWQARLEEGKTSHKSETLGRARDSNTMISLTKQSRGKPHDARCSGNES